MLRPIRTKAGRGSVRRPFESFFNLPQAELGAEGGYRKAESAGMPLH